VFERDPVSGELTGGKVPSVKRWVRANAHLATMIGAYLDQPRIMDEICEYARDRGCVVERVA